MSHHHQHHNNHRDHQISLSFAFPRAGQSPSAGHLAHSMRLASLLLASLPLARPAGQEEPGDLQVHSMVANMWYSGASSAGKHPALLGGLVCVFKGHRLSPTLAMLVFFLFLSTEMPWVINFFIQARCC